MYVAMYETWKLLRALLREAEKEQREEADAGVGVQDVSAAASDLDGDLDAVPDEEMLRLTLSCLGANLDHHFLPSGEQQPPPAAGSVDQEAKVEPVAAAAGQLLCWSPADELPDCIPSGSTTRYPPPPHHPDLIQSGIDGDDGGGRQERRGGVQKGVFRVDSRWLTMDQRQKRQMWEGRRESADVCDGRRLFVARGSGDGGGGRTRSEGRRIEEQEEEVVLRRHSFSGRYTAVPQNVGPERPVKRKEEWSVCGGHLARMAQRRQRRTSGQAARRASTPLSAALESKAPMRRRHSVPDGGGDMQSLLSDVCVFVTIAGAYYCLKKIKAALF
jgi:hypothetical protein